MRFALFGIPVHVRPAFWLVALMLGPHDAIRAGRGELLASWVAIVFVSVLVHELGHAFAMRRVGRTPHIELWGMGGLTYWGEGPRIAGWKRAAVSLAGPMAGFALAIPIACASHWLAIDPESVAGVAIEQALWVNVGWGALNLLPILPLDGGHVMEAALSSWLGARGPRVARFASIGVAAIAAALAMVQSQPGIAFVAVFAGMHALRGLASPDHHAGAIPARAASDPSIDRAIDGAWDSIREGRPEAAIAACEALVPSLPDDEAHGATRARVLETISWAQLEAGDERAAVAAASRMPARFHPSALLAARLQLAKGELDEGLRALERAFQDTPGDLPGLVLAATYVDLHRPERAVAMLRGLRGARLSSNAHLTISASLFYGGHFDLALAASELGWNRHRDPSHAYNAACSCARLGRIDRGLDWIRDAVKAGFVDRDKLERDDDLAPLRADPRWREAVAPRSK